MAAFGIEGLVSKINWKILAMANTACYDFHNSVVAVEEDGKLITVIEMERFVSQKNAGYGLF